MFVHDQHFLTLAELAETISYSCMDNAVRKGQQLSSEDIMSLLSGVVAVIQVKCNRYIGDEETDINLRLIDGIKEEPQPEDFQQGPASLFAMHEGQAKETIAGTCRALLNDTHFGTAEQ